MSRLTFALTTSRDVISRVNENPHHGSDGVRYPLSVFFEALYNLFNDFDTHCCHQLALVLLVILGRALRIKYKLLVSLCWIVVLACMDLFFLINLERPLAIDY